LYFWGLGIGPNPQSPIPKNKIIKIPTIIIIYIKIEKTIIFLKQKQKKNK
jgi:hypothetical protein